MLGVENVDRDFVVVDYFVRGGENFEVVES